MTTPYVDPDYVQTTTIGFTPSSTLFGTYADNSEAFARPPGCIAQRTSNQSCANGAATAIPFTAVDLRDTDNFHSPASSPGRITVPTGLGGWYRIDWSMGFSANATGYRDGVIRVNGSTAVTPSRVRVPAVSGVTTFISSTALVSLNAGDYVELLAQQNSGGALNVDVAQVGLTMVAWA